MSVDPTRLDESVAFLVKRLLDKRLGPDHWEGRLSSSALATATAVLALYLSRRNRIPHGNRLDPFIDAGISWLVDHQNGDGGWGDTVRSRSNISTTAITWATLSRVTSPDGKAFAAVRRGDDWLQRIVGATSPDALRSAILQRYGTDRTFSVPILTVLAVTGKLGEDASAWRSIPQLPFELARLPHGWFQHLRLPVVSYALPALIAIGQIRHHFAPSRNPAARILRNRVRGATHDVLSAMQPESGGYLEATPLTSFVVMSLAGMGRTDSPVVDAGIRFLLDSMRDDGSWPIDTNLATWVTTLSIGALTAAGELPAASASGLRRWLLDQQSRREHAFTHAAPGAWAWTPLSGGVPDADDTSGALLGLARLGSWGLDEVSRSNIPPDRDYREVVSAAEAGARWLLGVQNRDGGVPTFCRGWGTLPFDRSTPEITSHALQAWGAWCSHFDPSLQSRLRTAAARALQFLLTAQRSDGSWVPLWFGNENAPAEDNLTYGTAKVLLGLQSALIRDASQAKDARRRAVAWLLSAQCEEGGWGGSQGVVPTIEETGVALTALSQEGRIGSEHAMTAVCRGVAWLTDAVSRLSDTTASPVGLYFARLWYYEDLYPIVFALAGLSAARAAISEQQEAVSAPLSALSKTEKLTADG
jgi:squalene-hopene/tetraprenyl-beta-curcumene cyclase